MQYLQHQFPSLVPRPTPSEEDSTKSDQGILNLTHWDDFNISTILGKYGNVLENAVIDYDPIPPSPTRVMENEGAVLSEVYENLRPRIGRSLRSGFQFMAENNLMNDRTPMTIDVGDAACNHPQAKPDMAFFDFRAAPLSVPNRCPGCIRPAWEYHGDQDILASPPAGFLEGISDVSADMNRNDTRYGYLITDKGLVAIKRVDTNGTLQITSPIPWYDPERAASSEPQLTMLLALWYLGMLASLNEGPEQWKFGMAS